MKRKKEDYFVIGLALTLLIVVFGIAVVLLRNTNDKTSPNGPATKPTSAVVRTPSVTPLPTSYGVQPGSLNVDDAAQLRLLNRVEHRKDLSSDDLEAKAKILTILPAGKKSGQLYQSPNLKIEFVSSANLFMVEILTIDVGTAKNEANVWFRSKGMSQDAICNYPVMFYLNSDVLQRIKILNIKFSPVGNGC